ncbi:MAG: peptidoglycan binding protein CsiV [Gammaproteobacteria bacterium]|nr:peptidoglycan binding protein CsiV [Gammaproteobacteria bacterium]
MRLARFRPHVTAMTRTAAAVLCLLLPAQVLGQTPADQRWYQIEVTLFAHDNAMQTQEHWPLEVLAQPLPRTIRALARLSDVLALPAWQTTGTDSPSLAATESNAPVDSVPPAQELAEYAVPLHSSDFRLPDPERDAFLALPVSAHGFTDTNRALTNSARYQVLFHDAWRQPMTGSNQAIPIWITGGQQFGNRHELEGSLTLRFNPGQDRVVLDARLWLTQFSTQPSAGDEQISLPELPPSVIGAADQISPSTTEQQWYPVQIIPVVNTREMRSNEFHYIDHPAVGIVVHVFPYTVPPLPADPAALL